MIMYYQVLSDKFKKNRDDFQDLVDDTKQKHYIFLDINNSYLCANVIIIFKNMSWKYLTGTIFKL